MLPKYRWTTFFSRLTGTIRRRKRQRSCPRCPECAGLLQLRYDTKYAYCLDDACEFDGVEAGEIVAEIGQPKPGLPRPVIKSRRVPWITPVIDSRPAWIGLNASRRDRAMKYWLCQYCGEELDSDSSAWVATLEGAVAEGGALHEGCRDEARRGCPTLRTSREYVYVVVRRGDERHDWSVVTERLMAYDRQHGGLPDVLPLRLIFSA